MSDNSSQPDVTAAMPAAETSSASATLPAPVTPLTETPPAIPPSLSTLTQPLAAVPPESEIKRVPLGRLSAVEIRNYRAYRGTFRLELSKGENLLIYGENGAGKSSLFHTLRTFLEAPGLRMVEKNAQGQEVSRPIKITDDQHRFTSAEPSVKLEFGERVFEWTNAKNDTGHEIVRLLNQAKGFLDYKALLDVHLVRSGEKPEIDLFVLLIQRLLPHYTYSHRGVSRTFTERWAELQKEVKRTWHWTRRNKDPENNFLTELREFNEALDKAIADLGKRASTMLAIFGDEFQITFNFQSGEFKRWPKRIDGPKLIALPAFRKLQCPDYHSFLNEARLSALAICLFFAALKESPATGLRLLVLDDILIGLDMANRVRVVDLIREHFQDWQIIILTYSKAWFERLKDYLHKAESTPGWKSVVLCADWRSEDSSPHTVSKDSSPHIIAEGSGTLIEMADRHLFHKDYKAAAVYVRSALEALCNHTCAKASLPVVHVASPKDRQVGDYVDVLANRLAQLKDDTNRQAAAKLIARLREAQAFVLNRNSHFDVEEEDTLSGEVKAAIQTVKDLAAFFEKLSWKKANFHEGQMPPAAERMSIQLAEARKLARFGPKDEAIRKMAIAHHLGWESFGLREKIAIPIGSPLNAKTIWDAANLDAGFDARLKAARPYLFGNVDVKDFDAGKFEAAAILIEELAAPPAGATLALAKTP